MIDLRKKTDPQPTVVLSFTERLETLIEKAQSVFARVIEWKGVPSDHILNPCLKIEQYHLHPFQQFTELVFLNDYWVLIDVNGYQWALESLSCGEIMELADKLPNVNPYDSEAKIFPVLVYDGDEDLSDFPNFSVTGSVSGMKKQYYGKGAMLLRKGQYIYNVTSQPEIYLEVYDPDNDEELED